MSGTTDTNNVHDIRRHSFFILDNEIIKHYARQITPSGLAVYCCLVMHAGEKGAWIISTKMLADRSGVSQSTVKRVLHVLAGTDRPIDEDGNALPSILAQANLPPLISIAERTGEGGHRLASQYVILPIQKDGSTLTPHRVTDNPPGVKLNQGVVSDLPQGGVTMTPQLKDPLDNTQEQDNPHTPQGGQDAGNADAASDGKAAHTKPGELTPGQEARFDRWWQIYPRKEDKAVAKRAWKRCDPDDAQTDVMIAAVARQSVAKDWADPSRRRFIPLPSTWLNGARWEDEVDTATIACDPDLNLEPTPTNAARLGKARARAEFRAAPYLASRGIPLTPDQEARIRAGAPLAEVMTADQRSCAAKGFEELVVRHRNKIAMSY